MKYVKIIFVAIIPISICLGIIPYNLYPALYLQTIGFYMWSSGKRNCIICQEYYTYSPHCRDMIPELDKISAGVIGFVILARSKFFLSTDTDTAIFFVLSLCIDVAIYLFYRDSIKELKESENNIVFDSPDYDKAVKVHSELVERLINESRSIKITLLFIATVLYFVCLVY